MATKSSASSSSAKSSSASTSASKASTSSAAKTSASSASAGGGGTTKDFVANLYQTTLGRAPDAAGLQYWSDQITKGGLSPNAVANAIAKSPEGQLAQAYQQNLGRAADPAGMNYWKSQVASGALTVDQAVNAIARSPEAQSYVPGGAGGGGAGGGGGTQGPTQPGFDLESIIQGIESKYANQITALIDQLGEQQRINQAVQSTALQNQAAQNAAQGQFTPTTPPATTGLTSAGAGLNLTPITTTTPTATPQTAVTPAPAMYVPQTYLAPPPPQYRSVDPFASPFTSPFQLPSPYPQQRYPFGMPYPSPFGAAPQFMSYSDIAAAQVNPATQGQTPVVGPQGIAPIPYYQGYYQQPTQQAQATPAPAATTPTT